MSKEEKAAEMVRRREERKQVCSLVFFFSLTKLMQGLLQRIAALREQKKSGAK